MKSAAGAIGATGLGVAGSGRASAGGTGSMQQDIQISIKLYPEQGNYDNYTYATDAEDVLNNDLAPQFDQFGVNLTADIVPYEDRPDDSIQDMADFESHVKGDTNQATCGSALHMWIHIRDTDGGSRTPANSLVDGHGDAYSSVDVETSYKDSRQNMVYVHEAVHGFMEEGQPHFDCPGHDEDKDGHSDSEHTCGRVDVWRDNGYYEMEVSPMIGGYDHDNLGAVCGEYPSSNKWESAATRSYDLTLSNCTEQTLQNFFDYNGSDIRTNDPDDCQYSN